MPPKPRQRKPARWGAAGSAASSFSSQPRASSGSSNRQPRGSSKAFTSSSSRPRNSSNSISTPRPDERGRLPVASRLPMRVKNHSCLQIIKPVWLDEAKGLNFVFSPFSVYVALGLLASGSDGRTLEQILSFLKAASLNHLNSVVSQLIALVDGTKINGGGGPNLSFVGGIWIDNSCTLKLHFKEIANTIYKAEAEAVDFKTKAGEVRETVNKWVEEETNGLIKNLIPKDGSIDHATRLVLANALYFKGKWEQEFDSSRTMNSKFYLLDGSSVQVPFLTHYMDQYISCYNGFKVLQLPYQQQVSSGDPYKRHFSMYIFLPDERDGLGGLIDKVSSDPGFIDRHLPNKKVEVGEFRIPKFKISFSFEASTVLKNLGLVLPFDAHQAELDKMADGGDLYVSSFHHKCFVEVDEVGTEAAAAATCIFDEFYCEFEFEPIDFVAEHPFMFIIRDNISGLVLFIGHVLNPLLND